MKLQDKVNYLFDSHLKEWLKTRQETNNELSDKQSMFCCCGKLASGFHESGCYKFRKKVDAEAVKKLEHLLTHKSN